MAETLLGDRREPLRLTLLLTREAETFSQIATTARVLAGVNTAYFDLPISPTAFYFGRRNITKIKSFHIESPPVATIFADPAWLAVFIGLAALGIGALQVLGAYPHIKAGASEFSLDLRKIAGVARKYADTLISSVHGLAEHDLELLRRAVYEWLDNVTKAPVNLSKRLLWRATRLRKLIMDAAGRVLQIGLD
jgi:hypothetical protein